MEVIKLEKQEKNKRSTELKGMEEIKKQLNESYQSGVVEDQLENNRGIHHFNNKSR